MKKGGRQSVAELSVVTPRISRAPEPPEWLSEAESEVWRGVTATKPWDWFTEDNMPLLEDYARHVVLSRKVGKELQNLSSVSLADKDDLERSDRLMRMSEREAKICMSLATKLRLTQQSRYTTKAAGTADKGHERRTPWAS